MSDQEVISLPVKNRGRGGAGGGAEVCNENEQTMCGRKNGTFHQNYSQRYIILILYTPVSGNIRFFLINILIY